MCSKTSPVEEENQKTRTSTRIEKKKRRESSTSMEFKPPNLEASREIRVKKKTKKKKKKPKFLSLKLELNTCNEITQNPKTKKKSTKQRKKETINTEKNRDGVDQNDAVADKVGGDNEYDMVTEKEGGDQYDTVAAYLFNSGTDSTISSIHDLLHSSSAAVDIDCSGTILSPYDHKEHGNSSSSLLRTAMRKGGSEEKGAEERWVSYSEVVEEVMSRSGTPRWCGEDEEIGGGGAFKRHSLTLKLDYEHIMEAWSDKGTLYVDGELPQTVPDLHAAASADGVMGGGEAGNIWAVPEMEPTAMLWRGHREASLLRYKQKRQNRLFSKRIRYQVRKLNAEKRPRIKGRFVKRDDP